MTDNFKLVLDPNPSLYKKLENLDLDGYDLSAIESKMIEIMESFKGIGISANQVGFDRRVVVIKPKDKEPFALFNPEIINNSIDSVIDKEGCLSFPDLYLSIKRPDSVTVKYFDKTKKECIINLAGYDARCLQHEMDHIDGICFTSKISRLKLDLAVKKQRKIKDGRTK